MSEALLKDVVDVVVNAVNLHHVDRATLSADTVLARGGLGLDSIDILEVVVAIEHRFGVKLGNPQDGPTHFRSLGTIVEFVASRAGQR